MLSFNNDHDTSIGRFDNTSFDLLTNVRHYIDYGCLHQLTYFADLFSSWTQFDMTSRVGVIVIFIVITKMMVITEANKTAQLLAS